MKYEKNSKPPKCPIFSLILNFKIRPMGLKKKHESSRQNTSKMQVQISKREPTWTNVKREPTWNMKVHAKSWLRFTSGSRFTSVHVSRGNQTWHVGWGMRVYVYLLPPKKRKLTIPARYLVGGSWVGCWRLICGAIITTHPRGTVRHVITNSQRHPKSLPGLILLF